MSQTRLGDNMAKKRTQLDDLNHDPSLLYSLPGSEVKRLYEESEANDEAVLGGVVRSELRRLASTADDSPVPTDEESEDE